MWRGIIIFLLMRTSSILHTRWIFSLGTKREKIAWSKVWWVWRVFHLHHLVLSKMAVQQILRLASYFFKLIPTQLGHNSSISKVKLVTLVKGDPEAPFSIAESPRCRGRHYSILLIAPLYPGSLPYNADC